MTTNKVTTNYAVAPGEYIKEWLEDEERTQASLARDLGVSAKHVSKLINGAVLSPELALKLELVTSIPAKNWLALEAQYRADQTRLGMEKELERHAEIAKAFPLTALRKAGIITETMRKPGIVLMQLMSFFAVGDLEGLERQSQPLPAFRQDVAHPVRPESVRTWLRMIELELDASDPLEQPYDADSLRALIPELRELSRSQGASFEGPLVEKLASVGVRILFVPEISGTRAHGCTQWYGENPVITLTLRGRDDGKLWFTLFHEIGHVLLHPKNGPMVQMDGELQSAKEIAANEFASETLVPARFKPRLRKLRFNSDVIEFAEEIGVSPGIVVGQLHHLGLWERNRGHKLHNRFTFASE
ncbi:ImmA/IrrE family metallo-endopeptidase [Arthrobacter sp. S41]|uniref:ImmA/IrrE family metallo-endopeptidase n=1 Tax=Arthrobacter sp. S41 TaxID=2509721 RepID=UPI001035CB7F|nr:ImmA/IrrE family metallo-endopeptidase [Arthrobacter sp. S41]TAP26881.1 ImmA/IrrE family metallo-endopeptidase [Arthrobacter sp. S41]